MPSRGRLFFSLILRRASDDIERLIVFSSFRARYLPSLLMMFPFC